MIKSKYLFLCAAIVFLNGCAASTTNLSPVHHKDKPRIRIYKAPSLDNDKLKTFSVAPVSHLKKDPLVKDDIVTRHMLFLLRNTFEIRGYRYVEVTENPDMLATVDGHIQYKKDCAPPETLTSPKWRTKKRILDAYASGEMKKQTYTISHHTIGTCYPVVRIDVLNPDTLKPLWAGIGIGTASNSDLRISSQTIVIFLLGEFPKGPYPYERVMNPFGFGFFVFTNNGHDYYPTVFELIKKSPADKAGIELYDMISSVDGVSVKNRSVSEVLEMFQRESGGKKSIAVLRLNKQINLEIRTKPTDDNP